MFLVFDVELLFLYPWAVVAFRRAVTELGRAVFWCVLAFIGLLLVAYLYDWKKGSSMGAEHPGCHACET